MLDYFSISFFNFKKKIYFPTSSPKHSVHLSLSISFVQRKSLLHLSFVPNPFSLSSIVLNPQPMLPLLVPPICPLSPTVPPIHNFPSLHPSNLFPLCWCCSLYTSLIPPFPPPSPFKVVALQSLLQSFVQISQRQI